MDTQTPRPEVIIRNLNPSTKLYRARQKAAHNRIPKFEEAIVRALLSKLRRRQTLRLGRRNSDPDPYDPDYIFYCFTGELEQ